MSATAPFPVVGVSFRYVLILEWLEDDDRQTGAELHTYLQSIDMPSVHVVCRDADDVRQAINQACLDVAQRGIPAIQIETHGTDAYQVPVAEGGFGAGVTAVMTWNELGDWLAPLNAACDVRLLVVGAACFGLAAIAAMQLYEHVAPLAGCVGFTTEVDEKSVRDVMREFYRCIARGVPMHETVESAAREAHNPGEILKFTSSPKAALHVLRGVDDGIRTPEAMNVRVTSLLNQTRQAAKGFGLEIQQHVSDPLPEVLRERSRVHMQAAWDCWFPARLQARDPAYRLDWSLVEGHWS